MRYWNPRVINSMQVHKIQSLITSLSAQEFVRSGLSYTFSSFVMGVLSYLFNVVVARKFPLDQYGEYSSALASIAFFSVPLTAFTVIVIRRVGAVPAKDRSDYAAALFKALLFLLQKNVLVLLLFTSLFIAGLSRFANISLVTGTFIAIMVFLSYVSTYYIAVLQAQKDFTKAGMYLCVSSGLKLFVGSIALVWLATTEVLYGALFLATCFSLLYGSRLVLKNIRKKPKQVISFSLKRILQSKTVLVPLISSIGMIGLINVDVMMAKIVLSPEDAGLYAGLSLLGKIVYFLTAPIISVLYTFFIDAQTAAYRRKLLSMGVALISLAGLGAIVFYVLFSSQLVQLVFDERYLAIEPFVGLAGFFGGLFALVALLTQYYMAKLSRFSWLPVLACSAQVVAIALLPHTVAAIIKSNIGLVASLVLAYGAVFLLESHQDRTSS